jgi:PAS domain S-box-containing protein
VGFFGTQARHGGQTGWFRFRVAGSVVVLVGLLVSLAGVWRVGVEARAEIDRLAVASADTSQWALAQSEVELLTLRDRLFDAAIYPETRDLADVRLRFDVFYARMNILFEGKIFANLRADPEVGAGLEDLRTRLEALVPLIDGPDDALVAALPELTAELGQMATALRAVSLRGVQQFSEVAVERRNRVSQVLTNLAVFASVLVGLFLAVLIGLLAQLFQIRRARKKSKTAENRLRTVVETALDAVVVTDRNGLILDYNGAAEVMFGFAQSDMIGRPISVIVPPATNEMKTETADVSRHLLGGRGIAQFEARDTSGRHFPVEVATSLAQDTDQDVLVSFMRDISARAAAEQELVHARDKALAGEKAKSDLLAVMSHEMRTPINGIMGSLEVLADTDLSDKQRRFVDAIQSSGEMLLRHVNAVLDISRIDADGAVIVREVFAPLDVIETAIRALHGQAVARGNVVALDVLTDDLGLCRGDATSLAQVMLNLIGNAIKFTRDGKITVEVERIPQSDNVEIRITDTGVGIAPEDHDRIFSEFVTLDTRYAREVEGSGLGLAIVRRLCHLMQGEVGVESEPGQGSVFWVRVPLPAVRDGAKQERHNRTDSPVAPSEGAKVPRILLVEDNGINLLVAREMLASLGCHVTEARDGQTAIDKARDASFDLILMDISMPGMSGLEAAAAIRSGCALNRLTPIVAITAHEPGADLSRFRKSGISDVVTKPVSKQALRALLLRFAETDSEGRKHIVTLLSGSAEAQRELVATMGVQEAARITSLAHREITETLGRLTQLKEDIAARESESDIHHLAGLAGIVGFSHVRSELLAAQEAARRGDGAALMARLTKAQQSLALQREADRHPQPPPT